MTEERIFLWFYHLANWSAPVGYLVIFLATYLGWLLALWLGWRMFRAVEERQALRPFLAFSLAALGAVLLALLIKKFYYYPRPFMALAPLVKSLLPQVSDSSFPSAHAAVFAALAVVARSYRRSWGRWFVASAILIGLARVAAGLHWPLDIMVGWLLGVAVGTCLIRLFRYNRPYHGEA